MPSYKAPLSEIRYVLHDALRIESHYRELGRGDVTAELIDSVLEECARFAENVVAPTNEAGDRIGVRRTDDGRVVTPPGFIEAYRQYVGDGWAALCGSPEYGGQGLPESIGGPVGEMLVSANMSWKLYSGLTDSSVLCLQRHASEEILKLYLPKMISGAWSGTMVLTEPHAGTDLGLMRTRAEPAGDGTYKVSGTKIFITSGEHDLTENIVHMVLAKLPDAPAGSRGISLFVVPKFLPDASGTPGAANGVSCASVEHKLGIHGSATCVMNFDGAKGWLIGELNGGLKCMFTMMNHARLWVGLQGLAQCERGLQASVAYARERRQGRTAHGGPSVAADPIIGHPDVRRMLLTQKALIEGARLLTYFAGTQMDSALHHPDAGTRRRAEGLLAILTPVVKGFVTDMSLECTSLAIQVHGGHGYVRETGVEQFFRDARITQIYEGANGVQAMDLLGRKVLGSGGELPRLLGGLIGGFCERHAGSEELSGFVPRLAGLLKEWSEATEGIARRAARNPDETGAAATDYLQLTGYLCLAWSWAWMAATSAAAIAKGGPVDFHRAKLATARFYFARILPRAEAHLDALGAGAATLMDVPDGQFSS